MDQSKNSEGLKNTSEVIRKLTMIHSGRELLDLTHVGIC